jgi:hypothetical protein
VAANVSDEPAASGFTSKLELEEEYPSEKFVTM